MHPDWVREIALGMYEQGMGLPQVRAETGVSLFTLHHWCRVAGIMRSISEVKKDQPKGERNPNWKGDQAGYSGQHIRAQKDFPKPLGICQMPGCEKPAIHRARIDHTNLPYRLEYVMPMCASCNTKHDLYIKEGKIAGGFVILFKEVP